MYSEASASQPVDFALKEASSLHGGGQISRDRVTNAQKPVSTYDLVEEMLYLFIHVVKARGLPTKDITGTLDPYVELRCGNYKGLTQHIEKEQNPEWNVVFALPRERLQASILDVAVKDKDFIRDDIVGLLHFDLKGVPRRVPPESALAPEWYHLKNNKGDKIRGELMLALWIGNEADEAFPDAWHPDAGAPANSFGHDPYIRSKVYHAPRLWYVRVCIIEAMDIVIAEKARSPEFYVKVQIGNQVHKTRTVQERTMNPMWNEDFMFVAAEPLEDCLILSVENRVTPNKNETIGYTIIPLVTAPQRQNDQGAVSSRWYNIEKRVAGHMGQLKKEKFSSRLHLRIYLDGGYHVVDEATPTAKELLKSSIGLLELGILNAKGFPPIKDRKGTFDTYCLAKYGPKWIRTRTIMNSLGPRYNEQYKWQVYDPATVLTVGVFDNCQLGEKGTKGNIDGMLGKVRIRLSTLETGRVYSHWYPLLVLHPSGVKKSGELHLAIRFSCTSLVSIMGMYSCPLLPEMHYIRPLRASQRDHLRHHAVQLVAARLNRMEPPLGKEVVEYMCDVDSQYWSMRRSKANFLRLVSVFSGLFSFGGWCVYACAWKNPLATVLVHVIFAMFAYFPKIILPSIFLCMFIIGIWNYRYRPGYPLHMNTRISHVEVINPDELDEEFDTFPSTVSTEILRMRYDRLRNMSERIQNVAGHIASQGERIQTLLSWRDPWATAIFVPFCLISAIVLFVTPFRWLVVLAGFYTMRHPRLRHTLPPAPINFFSRLPTSTDSML